jgi:hypothetical protein
MKPVRMFVEDTPLRYSTVHASNHNPDAEWQLLFPGDGLFELDGQIYTMSMFHQLRCLNVLRKHYITSFTTGVVPPQNESTYHQPIRHCFNYLRQMILCRSDLWIVPVIGNYARLHPTDAYICRDWELVYHRLERWQASSRLSAVLDNAEK